MNVSILKETATLFLERLDHFIFLSATHEHSGSFTCSPGLGGTTVFSFSHYHGRSDVLPWSSFEFPLWLAMLNIFS